jgi:hypothetical protein
MVFLLSGGQAQLLLGERLGCVEKLKQHGSMACLEPTSFGRAQPLVRKLEIGDGIERFLNAVKACLEPCRQRAHG